MASNQMKMIFTTILLLSLAYLSVSSNTNNTVINGSDHSIDIVVEGMVYCQSCDKKGSWSFTGANPISKATISVICKHGSNRISFYKAFQTNTNGYFYAKLDGFKMNHSLLDHPLQACRVKLVASSLSRCNLFTNVNNGLSGANLRYEGKRLVGKTYEAVVFAVGPLAFRPAHCIPRTHV